MNLKNRRIRILTASVRRLIHFYVCYSLRAARKTKSRVEQMFSREQTKTEFRILKFLN